MIATYQQEKQLQQHHTRPILNRDGQPWAHL
jgi:hypothetical protein